MSNSWRYSGIGAAAEYLVAGPPFVTSSGHEEIKHTAVTKIRFPYVTSWFQIRHSGSNSSCTGLRVGFTSNGVQGKGAVTGSAIPNGMPDETANNHRNYFVIPKPAAADSETSLRLELKCQEIYLMAEGAAAGVTIVAGLTGIPNFPIALSGSNGFYGVG